MQQIKNMIKKLHAYIIREFFWSFLLGVLIFSLLLILNLVFEFMDLFLSKGVAVFLVLKLFVFWLPNILTLAIPMAVLFGILLAYGRLSSDNEITVMKSSGLDYKTLTMPVTICICVVSFFLLFFNHFLAPVINARYKSLTEEVMTKRPLVRFNEKAITDIGEYHICANKVDNNNNSLYEMSIYKFGDNSTSNEGTETKNILPQNDKGSWRITASFATVKAYENCMQLTMHRGYWQKAHPENLNAMLHMTFETYVFSIPLDVVVKEDGLLPAAIQSHKLLKTIKESKKQGLATTAYECEKDYWYRWIFAFAPFAFALVALPIGMMVGKHGKAMGFGVSFAVILIYYTLLILSTKLGEKEYAPIGIVLWIPNFVITIIGTSLFIKMVKK
ncbi:MAG: LptF/LptG family permease [Endomicrobium sp.]|uniref:LptF/LptG family permease n=1 Tax=Candidatus Endomicrobiellum pyrsonymphae TaxID=1408203 RepID=UPI00357EA9BD|nr:LptF/LptG family permease [Endomicrobium sp.]